MKLKIEIEIETPSKNLTYADCKDDIVRQFIELTCLYNGEHITKFKYKIVRKKNKL